MAVILWHNPRCSKSREALALLQARGVAVTERRYLEDVPTLAELRAAQARLGLTAMEMMRIKEPAFKARGLSPDSDEATLLAAMAEEPKLIERPLAFAERGAVIDRPPERVLDIL
ncbi:arsenate reductase (glutaredoxin) [Ponticoccus litoralis]|uniref:Arsenate reductase n=1 Tax=Ponticoccus litoralis TaxID=422297 RepID=A0AAW9S9L0_9RHOB